MKKHYLCTLMGCYNKSYAKGLCHNHYNIRKIKKPKIKLDFVGLLHKEIEIKEVDFMLHEYIRKSMTRLSEREQIIIKERFFKCRTLQEVSEIFNVSRERIRHIEQWALRKLKAVINETHI